MYTTIIGTGGSGGWFCQVLVKSDLTNKEFVLIDGDTWSKSNLTRQFCTRRDIGKPKVKTFQDLLGAQGAIVVAEPEYFAYQSQTYNKLFNSEDRDICLVVGVDNHPARRVAYTLADEIYAEADERNVTVISMANEYETASAWVYLPEWKGTPLDPRVIWPEILTSEEGDPLRPPCTGEALQSAPQLALSNMLSASAGAWLYRFWTEVKPKLENNEFTKSMPDMLKNLRLSYPVCVDFTAGANKTYTVNDRLNQEK
jgi:hypothetical protein